MPSIFTQIIENKIPSFEIFQNDQIISFLALDQINPGHCLVVPKIEIDHFFDVPEPHYQEMFRVAKLVSKAIQKYSDAPRVGAQFQGFEVNHAHLHLIPAWGPQDMKFEKAVRLPEEEMLNIQTGLKLALKQFL